MYLDFYLSLSIINRAMLMLLSGYFIAQSTGLGNGVSMIPWRHPQPYKPTISIVDSLSLHKH